MIFLPTKYIEAAGALLAPVALAVTVAIATWAVQGWRLGGQINELKRVHTQQALDAARDHTAAIEEQQRLFKEAQDAATAKETLIRRDADGARSQLAGLRGELASARASYHLATQATLVERAIALDFVFEQCAGRYTVVAEKADRHALDAAKLQQICKVTG